MMRLKKHAIAAFFMAAVIAGFMPRTALAHGTSLHSEPASPSDLYRTVCSNCHGINGDGNGMLGRFLTPLPRDFGSLQYKLISTNNGMPSKEDIFKIIAKGIPGTSMPRFDALTDEELWKLAEEVGYIGHQLWSARNPNASAQELDRSIISSKPPEAITPPANVSKELISRGKTLYNTNCASCHGKTGTGNGPLAGDLEDRRGDPIRPRNFVSEPLKGGTDSKSVYFRIRNGMPGSPMPAFSLTEEDLWALVFYLKSSFLESKKQ